jgi:hypothetical protein
MMIRLRVIFVWRGFFDLMDDFHRKGRNELFTGFHSTIQQLRTSSYSSCCSSFIHQLTHHHHIIIDFEVLLLLFDHNIGIIVRFWLMMVGFID